MKHLFYFLIITSVLLISCKKDTINSNGGNVNTNNINGNTNTPSKSSQCASLYNKWWKKIDKFGFGEIPQTVNDAYIGTGHTERSNYYYFDAATNNIYKCGLGGSAMRQLGISFMMNTDSCLYAISGSFFDYPVNISWVSENIFRESTGDLFADESYGANEKFYNDTLQTISASGISIDNQSYISVKSWSGTRIYPLHYYHYVCDAENSVVMISDVGCYMKFRIPLSTSELSSLSVNGSYPFFQSGYSEFDLATLSTYTAGSIVGFSIGDGLNDGRLDNNYPKNHKITKVLNLNLDYITNNKSYAVYRIAGEFEGSLSYKNKDILPITGKYQFDVSIPK